MKKKESVKSQMFSIAVPVMFNLLFMQIQLIIDRAFLGHVNSDYLSAIGNVNFPLWTSMSVIWALGTGSAILISQSLGAGKRGKAEDYGAASLKYNSFLSILLFLIWFFFSGTIFKLMGVAEPVLGYSSRFIKIYSFSIIGFGLAASVNAIFQGSKMTSPIMYAGFFKSGLNIILDYILIFGNLGFPAMGLEGAAFATLISDCIGTSVLVSWMMLSRKLPVKINIKKTVLSPLGDYLKIIKIGIPSSLEEFLWNFGNLILVRFLNAISILAAGIYTLIFSIELIPALIFVSIGQASTTMAGYKTGEGNKKGIKKIINTGMASCWIISLAFAIIFYFFPRPILSAFSKDADVINNSVVLLLISCCTFLPKSANIIFGGGIRGQGNTKWMLFTQIFGTAFIVCISFLYMFVLNLGILGLFLAVFTDELVRSGINGMKFYRSINHEMRFFKLEDLPGKADETA